MERKKLLKHEVVKLFNTTSETLRHYENMGLLTPEINEKNYRLYDFEELHQLRQVLLFKELELSLEDMKMLIYGEYKEEDYLKLLNRHKEALEQKIDRLIGLKNDIGQIMNLMENSQAGLSFLLRDQAERAYYALDPLDSDVMTSPKKYYDKFKEIIETDAYSEKTLRIFYKYDDLKSGDHLASKICIETPRPQENSIILEAGTYLSVFYPFRHGNFSDLPQLQNEIEMYLKDNKLKRVSENVIELERPELSLFLEEDVTVFEIQIRVQALYTERR